MSRIYRRPQPRPSKLTPFFGRELQKNHKKREFLIGGFLIDEERWRMIIVNRQFKIDILKKKGMLERITQEVQTLLSEIPDEYLKIDKQHRETLDIVKKWLRYATKCIDSDVDQKNFVNQVKSQDVNEFEKNY
jgi:translation initiation factor 2 gamma subunit (eIF-2gamma)